MTLIRLVVMFFASSSKINRQNCPPKKGAQDNRAWSKAHGRNAEFLPSATLKSLILVGISVCSYRVVLLYYAPFLPVLLKFDQKMAFLSEKFSNYDR